LRRPNSGRDYPLQAVAKDGADMIKESVQLKTHRLLTRMPHG